MNCVEQVEKEKVISWSLMKDLIRKFHVCPFCFEHMTGEETIYLIGEDRKHPQAYKVNYGKSQAQAVAFPVFAVHNSCPTHGCLTGDYLMTVKELSNPIFDSLEETSFGGAISKAAELGWVIDWKR